MAYEIDKETMDELMIKGIDPSVIIKSDTYDIISRRDVIEAIENMDWYHIKDGKLILGANSVQHEPLFKASDVFKMLRDLPSAFEKGE